MSVLQKIGQGLVSLGSGMTQSEIDTIRANRDMAEQGVEINQQTIDANKAVAEQNDAFNQLSSVVIEGGPDADKASKRLFQLFPKKAEELLSGIGIVDDAGRERIARRSFEIASQPTREAQDAVIQRHIAEGQAEGRDMSDSISLLEMSDQERAAVLRFSQAAVLSAKDRITQQNTETGQAQSERQLDQADRRLGQGDRSLDLQEGSMSFKAGDRINDQVKQDLETEEGLRKEFNTLIKDFLQVSQASERMLAAGNNPSAAGDLALIFNYMKMLDPGSTVREGEFANAANSAGVPQRVVGLYNSLINGERLSDQQRNDFLQRGMSLFGAAQSEAEKTANNYERIARDAGVNVDNIIGEFQQRSASQQVGVSAPPAAIEFLRANDTPETRNAFVDKYGALPDGM